MGQQDQQISYVSIEAESFVAYSSIVQGVKIFWVDTERFSVVANSFLIFSKLCETVGAIVINFLVFAAIIQLFCIVLNSFLVVFKFSINEPGKEYW